MHDTVTEYYCLKCGEKCEVYKWSEFGMDIVCKKCSHDQKQTVFLKFGEYKMEIKTREIK